MNESTPTEEQTVSFESITPTFYVDDILKTTNYYKEVLGFEIDMIDGDPPTFSSVDRDGISINFLLEENNSPTNTDRFYLFIMVNNIEELIKELQSRGATIIEIRKEEVDKSICLMEVEVEDCNNYRIHFGEYKKP
ncbi:MAG: hypothetical protein KGZ58_01730 [Ignavibacteriales bacterium]|nr:hypothetical protein [Ignavibacteriales bacterium]